MLHRTSHFGVPSKPQLLETQVSSEGVSIREAEVRQDWSLPQQKTGGLSSGQDGLETLDLGNQGTNH